MLQRTSIKKLLRESFSGTPPLRVGEEGAEPLFEQIRERIEHIEGIKEITDFSPYIKTPEGEHLYLSVSSLEPERRHYGYYNSSIQLHFFLNVDNTLIVECEHEQASVANIDQIALFSRAYQARLQRRRAQQAKREKLRDFKTRAIIAKIKEIAQKERFDFATQVDRVKVSLYVRFNKQQFIKIYIPFGRFQDVLSKLPQSLRLIRELQELGLQFQVSRHGYARMNWVEYKSLESDEADKA